MADVIEKLKEYAQYAETKSERDTFEVAFQEIARLREENARLLKALRPFAMTAHSDIDSNLNLLHAICSLTLDDFRRARTAIREGGNDENKKD